MGGGRRWAPFAWGFRPFFLLTGLYAIITMVAWLFVYMNGMAPFGAFAPSLWHAHEMLYGLVGAAIGGFLLTAVPNWTGRKSIRGAPLAMLALVWIAGRVAMSSAAFLPATAVAFSALLFVPLLFAVVLKTLLGAENRRLPILLLLIAYWLADVIFFLSVYSDAPGPARTSLGAGIGIVLLLVTIIGGRIVPVFTANALRRHGLDIPTPATPRLDRAVILSMIVYLIADVLHPATGWLATISTVAGMLQFARFVQWHGLKSWREPIVWILHVAYAALPTGLLLRALYLSTGSTWAVHWQHLLTIGGAATMILAVMTRAALGHTGRPLKVASVITFAYLALVAATLARVFGPSVLPYVKSVMLAGGLWLFAFALYTITYAPILTRPRADGEPG